jgi:hypothetical protein
MCVFKYHAFIYFVRPPPCYGTLSKNTTLAHSKLVTQSLYASLFMLSLYFLARSNSIMTDYTCKPLIYVL